MGSDSESDKSDTPTKSSDHSAGDGYPSTPSPSQPKSNQASPPTPMTGGVLAGLTKLIQAQQTEEVQKSEDPRKDELALRGEANSSREEAVEEARKKREARLIAASHRQEDNGAGCLENFYAMDGDEHELGRMEKRVEESCKRLQADGHGREAKRGRKLGSEYKRLRLEGNPEAE